MKELKIFWSILEILGIAGISFLVAYAYHFAGWKGASITFVVILVIRLGAFARMDRKLTTGE